ncbi:MAG: glutamate ABC transporter substrate-binding protein [Chloroflexi bacterium]|nr:glutamate ABC transporter substrate-binding protein [Chloroflexota bacterium]
MPASPIASPAAVGASAAVAAALPAPGDMPAGSYMKQVQDRGKLNAGVKTDVLLFGYLNPRANKIEGFDVDMAREVARAIFGDPNKIDLKEVTSASRIPAVKEGIVDLFVATATITKERLNEIDFSGVYYEAGQQLLVPKNSTITSIEGAAGKRICAATGSTSEQNIKRSQPQAQVVQTDKYSDCLLAVQQGRADGVSTDDVILMGLAEQDPNMKIVGKTFTQEPYGIGLAKTHPEFTQFVNGVLARLKQSGRWAEIHKQWLGKFIETPAPPTRTAAQAAGV